VFYFDFAVMIVDNISQLSAVIADMLVASDVSESRCHSSGRNNKTDDDGDDDDEESFEQLFEQLRVMKGRCFLKF